MRTTRLNAYLRLLPLFLKQINTYVSTVVFSAIMQFHEKQVDLFYLFLVSKYKN